MPKRKRSNSTSVPRRPPTRERTFHEEMMARDFHPGTDQNDHPRKTLRDRSTSSAIGTDPPDRAKNRLLNVAQDFMHLIPKYRYPAIKSDRQIRLLRIRKAVAYEAELQCELIVTPIETKGGTSQGATRKYWALSYCWGDDLPDKPISIYKETNDGPVKYNVFDKRYTFFIRSNLDAAFRRFREQENDILVWVDAICINQEDPVEKASQVAMMDRIYRQADNVAVWLGAGTEESESTFEFMAKILNLTELDEMVQGSKELDGQTISKYSENWKMVANLMTNKWFSRRWIIQELSLAQSATIHWGKAEMDVSVFSDAIELYVHHEKQIKTILEAAESREQDSRKTHHFEARELGASTLVDLMTNLFRKSDEGDIQYGLLSLETLVSSRLLAFEASDPRDTIYTVLSIAKDTSSLVPKKISTGTDSGNLDERVAPNYDKSLLDVFVDFMDYCIDTSKSLDILCRSWAPRPRKLTKTERMKKLISEREKQNSINKDDENRREKLPSWIPSIRRHAFGDPKKRLRGRCNGDSFVGNSNRHKQAVYNASGDLPPECRFGRNEVISDNMNNASRRKLLKPAGQTPAQKTSVYDGTMIVKGLRLGAVTKLSDCATADSLPYNGLKMGGWSRRRKRRKLPDKLWRTLVADRSSLGENPPGWYVRALRECLAHVDNNNNLPMSKVLSQRGISSHMRIVLERVQKIVFHRQFFESKEGTVLFGLAPPKAQKGDLICVIFGCSVPVVLRPAEDSGSLHYKFIGECYVHGMMDGEAVNGENPELGSAVDFELR